MESMHKTNEKNLEGEYAERGEYHKHLDPTWSYYPIYIRKIAYVEKYLISYGKCSRILDAGCGEGVLVQKFRENGRDIVGLDKNYSSSFVVKGDVLDMPFNEKSFEVVLLLDVIEHLQFHQQLAALVEIRRVLTDAGELVISVPNLAHWASRWNFYKKGALVRTANILKHPGDRPVSEYLELFNEAQLEVGERIPIKLTLPPVYDRWIQRFISEKQYEKFIYSEKRNPDDCFLNIFVLRKR